MSNVVRCRRGMACCSDRLPIRSSCSSCKPVSSKVSRIAVCARLRSKISLWPPGNAMSPDHGSPVFLARFINNISIKLKVSRNTIATAASRVTGSRLCWKPW